MNVNYLNSSLSTIPSYLNNTGLSFTTPVGINNLGFNNSSLSGLGNNINNLTSNLLSTIDVTLPTNTLNNNLNYLTSSISLPLSGEDTGYTTGFRTLDRLGELRGTRLGRILSAPLAAYSLLVGHDGALRAARNGDIAGWYVNRFDHSSHSHALGGNQERRSASPLAIIGTIGQEIGNLIGLDQSLGTGIDYDLAHGTNYAIGHSYGEPTHITDLIRLRD